MFHSFIRVLIVLGTLIQIKTKKTIAFNQYISIILLVHTTASQIPKMQIKLQNLLMSTPH